MRHTQWSMNGIDSPYGFLDEKEPDFSQHPSASGDMSFDPHVYTQRNYAQHQGYYNSNYGYGHQDVGGYHNRRDQISSELFNSRQPSPPRAPTDSWETILDAAGTPYNQNGAHEMMTQFPVYSPPAFGPSGYTSFAPFGVEPDSHTQVSSGENRSLDPMITDGTSSHSSYYSGIHAHGKRVREDMSGSTTSSSSANPRAKKMRRDQIVTEDGRYACPAGGCDQTYAHRGDLKSHFIAKHPHLSDMATIIAKPRSTKAGKKFPCPADDCKCGFHRKQDLRRHLRRKHADQIDNAKYKKLLPQGKTVCPVCDKVFHRYGNYVNHSLRIHKRRVVPGASE